jgi:hypothetical protein
MGQFTQASAVGEGQSFIDGGTHHPIIYVVYEVLTITNPKVRITGSTFPRRLQFAGSLQLLTGDLDHTGTHQNVPNVDWPVTWEMAEYDPPMSNLSAPICDAIHWLLPSGIELWIQVNW